MGSDDVNNCVADTDAGAVMSATGNRRVDASQALVVPSMPIRAVSADGGVDGGWTWYLSITGFTAIELSRQIERSAVRLVAYLLDWDIVHGPHRIVVERADLLHLIVTCAIGGDAVGVVFLPATAPVPDVLELKKRMLTVRSKP